MSAANALAVQTDPLQQAADAGAAPSRSRSLISLVHKLIDYGKDLMATLKRPCTETAHYRITRSFGTLNLDLIVARITHGLRLALGLERRLLRCAARLDAPRRAAPAAAAASTTSVTAAPRARPARRPRGPARQDLDTALLSGLPTAEEIRNMIRRRPIGAVIADICHNLGIDTTCEFWRELHEAVALNGGRLLQLVKDHHKRTRLTNFLSPDTVMVPPPPPNWRAAVSPTPHFATTTAPP